MMEETDTDLPLSAHNKYIKTIEQQVTVNYLVTCKLCLFNKKGDMQALCKSNR